MSSHSPSFESLCKLLDNVKKARGSEKRTLLENYFKRYQSNYGPSVFEPLRLILSKCDDERTYNVKHDRMATILIKALLIAPNSDDAKRLKHFKTTVNQKHSGDFAATAFEQVKKRSTVTTSNQTIKDVNNYLDKFAKRDADQVEIFKELLSKFTPTQIQWLICIILKDMGLHCGDGTVLNAIHPDANETYSNHKSLRDIADPSYFVTNSPGSHFKLFNIFVPQTAERYSRKLFDQLSKPVYCETKLDGERLLMHYDREQDRFLWHSRRRHINDRYYGTSARDFTKLSGHIFQGIKSNQIILDGEMVAYDPPSKLFLPFGTLKNSTSEDINDPISPHPCFVVFDILMVDNTPLIDYSLEERTKALKALVKDQGTFMKIIERKELETEEEIKQELEKAYKNQEEGLMIKSKTDKYVIDKRSPKWLKLKPEYVEHMRETHDLLVVGARFGGGRRGGKIASLLFAVRDDRIPDTDPPRFVTFTLAGSGLNDIMMAGLKHLMKNMVDRDPKETPHWLIHPIKGGETFDVILGYQESLVYEVLGSQIVESTKFGMANTLRFPRVVKLRADKGWQDIETYSGLLRSKEEVGTKREAVEQIIKKSSKKRKGTLLSSQKGLDSSGITQISEIFKDKIFYVINGTTLHENDPKGLHKSHFDKLIKENGGKYIQGASNADIIVAGISSKDSEVKGIIRKSDTPDILLPAYIIDCIDAERLLPISPKYMFYTSLATQAAFAQTLDTYGDPYSKKMAAKDLTETFERMPDIDEKDDADYRKLAKTVNQRYFPEGISGMMFLHTVAYFDFDTSQPSSQPTPVTPEWVSWKRCQEELGLAKSLFVSEGGRISQDISDETITHIILNKNDLSRFKDLVESIQRPVKPRFVVSEWIKECHKQETLVNDSDYNPKNYHNSFKK